MISTDKIFTTDITSASAGSLLEQSSNRHIASVKSDKLEQLLAYILDQSVETESASDQKLDGALSSLLSLRSDPAPQNNNIFNMSGPSDMQPSASCFKPNTASVTISKANGFISPYFRNLCKSNIASTNVSELVDYLKSKDDVIEEKNHCDIRCIDQAVEYTRAKVVIVDESPIMQLVVNLMIPEEDNKIRLIKHPTNHLQLIAFKGIPVISNLKNIMVLQITSFYAPNLDGEITKYVGMSIDSQSKINPMLSQNMCEINAKKRTIGFGTPQAIKDNIHIMKSAFKAAFEAGIILLDSEDSAKNQYVLDPEIKTQIVKCIIDSDKTEDEMNAELCHIIYS